MLAAYTYQHSIGVADEDEVVGPEPQNTYDMRAERGDVSPDFRHQFTAAWTYELPFGPGKRYFNSDGPARWFASGWQLNGIVTMYSGQSITPLLSYRRHQYGFRRRSSEHLRKCVLFFQCYVSRMPFELSIVAMLV